MSKQPPNPASPDDLADVIAGRRQAAERAPAEAGDRHFGIRIDRDGIWYYRGSPIRRKPLCKLFSTVLRREEDGFWLVTPVERGRIDVDDAPFLAVEVTVTGGGPDASLTFRTNLDEEVTANADHPIRVAHDPDTEEPSPYILVRDNLDALISRSVFYELVEMAEEREEDGSPVLGVWSEGQFFALGRPE